MIAQVTDCAESIGAVRMRSPLSSRSRLKAPTALAMLSWAILPAVDEASGVPVFVDRGALVVDEPCAEADRLDGVEVEVGVDSRSLLRPGDPEPVRRSERLLQGLEAALELDAARREEHEYLRARLRPELRGERRRRVVLVSHQGAVREGRGKDLAGGL